MKKLLFGLGTLAALLSSPPGWTDEDLERAIVLAADDRRAEARAVLDGVLERSPDLPRARLLDGILHARAGLVNEAIEVFDRLRRDHPDMSEPWNNLAVLYAAQGRFDEARETLLSALGRKPSAVAYANLGDIYATLARQAYVRASELDPDSGVDPDRGVDPDSRLAPNPGPKPGTTFELPDRAGAPLAAAETSEPAPPRAPAAAAASETGAAQTPAADPGGLLPAVVVAGAGDAPDQPPGGESRDDAAATRTVAAATPAPEPVCLRTGEFEDRRVLATVEDWLRSHGADAIVVRREGAGAVTSYQVYLPPFATRARAVARTREIQANGVRDVAVIGTGPLANGVSFGVFGVEENMRRRMAALAKLGYPVQMRENRGPARGYVLAARAVRSADVLRAAWAKAFPGQSIELEDCG
ncbi:MAG: tetratricopeptide repeat protein [Immundisolibacterales bacterium]|nr:tetratricopeptide repeat protein [Immundisolibacterales bacterium]